jgi:hypothetical protein
LVITDFFYINKKRPISSLTETKPLNPMLLI